MYIERIEQLEKGRRRLVFETGERLVLYKGEIRSYDLSEGQDISETLYQELLCDVLGKRATKRAMHLLEKQDRTEYQLREKLRQNEYPKEAVEQAIAYVKSYHYIDDLRYACSYVRYQKEKKRSRAICLFPWVCACHDDSCDNRREESPCRAPPARPDVATQTSCT